MTYGSHLEEEMLPTMGLALTQEDESTAEPKLNWGDYVAVSLYFLAVISVGLWVSKQIQFSLI